MKITKIALQISWSVPFGFIIINVSELKILGGQSVCNVHSLKLFWQCNSRGKSLKIFEKLLNWKIFTTILFFSVVLSITVKFHMKLIFEKKNGFPSFFGKYNRFGLKKVYKKTLFPFTFYQLRLKYIYGEWNT